MKGIGVILIVLGSAGLVYALNMETTVYVPGQHLRHWGSPQHTCRHKQSTTSA